MSDSTIVLGILILGAVALMIVNRHIFGESPEGLRKRMLPRTQSDLLLAQIAADEAACRVEMLEARLKRLRPPVPARRFDSDEFFRNAQVESTTAATDIAAHRPLQPSR